MNTFFYAKDLGDLNAAVAEAMEVKRNRFAWQHLGKNKTLLMVFFDQPLETSVRVYQFSFCALAVMHSSSAMIVIIFLIYQ